MFKHHFLIAFRNLQRHKGSFLINLIGLSTGLVCTFLICLWVNDELHFDKFHANDAQLFQVMEKSQENSNVVVHENSQGPLAAAMAKDLPEVEMAVPVLSLANEGMQVTVKTQKKAVKTTGLFAGKDFFKVFSFPLIQGRPAQVLTDKNAIVISEQLAISLFGSPANAIDKDIEWDIIGRTQPARITGVFAKLPDNNSMKFDFAGSFDGLLDIVPNFTKWWNEGATTYLLLRKGTDVQNFNARIGPFITRYMPTTIFTLFVRPYSSGYLYGNYENGVQTGGRIEYVRLFSIVAIFILAIACINFMNLSTAKASRRLKEVGIKKAIGSSRKALVLQFISEAIFMALLALIVAGVIVVALLPMFNQVTGKHMSIHVSGWMIGWALGITLVTGLLSGSYPAFYLSGFNPIEVLKGKAKASLGELLARKGLVVFQFTISLVLIVSVMVIYRQIVYVQTKNLGYDRDHVVYFDKDGALTQNAEAFLTELKKVPGVINASAMQANIIHGIGGASTYGIQWPGKTNKDLVNFEVRAVDYNLIELLELQLKEGRSFSAGYGAEDTKLVFNEAAIKAMGLKNPIGTPIEMWGKKMSIAGVVKDFHLSSFHDPIIPLVFMYAPEAASTVMAKIQAGKEQSTIARVEALYKKFNPGYIFESRFLDDAYQAQYVAERRVATLSRYFAGLAIIISCLGLFGLATFNAEVRTKEIGIRKVLGASVSQVMIMLSKDFVKLIGIAILIAFPLGWWAMNNWLSSFVYHINMGKDVFIIAGVSILAITLLTISYQSFRAAVMNPVKSLRTE